MKLYSKILGEGEPFLILHGFMGMSDNWKTLGNRFAEAGYQVHLIDQRNHGRSPHSAEFNYEVMAADIKSYCEAHCLEDCILMGHSMGGKTAMLMACEFPQLVKKLIVVDISPKFYSPHHQQLLQGLKAVDQTDLSSRGEAEEMLSQYVPEKSVRLFLLKNLYRKTKEKLALRLNLDVFIQKTDAIGEALPVDKKFQNSTLFLKGGKSDYIQENDKKLISEHFPNSKIITIPDTGHWVHAQNPQEFYRQIMNFL